MCERRDQRLWRMAELEMPCSKPRRNINLSLPVEGVEQGRADRLSISGQVIEFLAVLARDAGRRHIEIACKVERHRALQDAAHSRDGTVATGGFHGPQHLDEGLGREERRWSWLPDA